MLGLTPDNDATGNEGFLTMNSFSCVPFNRLICSTTWSESRSYKDACTSPKNRLPVSRRIAQSRTRRKVAVVRQVLLPVIAQPEHHRGMMLKIDRVLDESIRFMLSEGETRIPRRHLEQHRVLGVEGGETGKLECPAEIRRVRSAKRFRKKCHAGPERVRVVDIVDDILNFHPRSVLRKC